jgi:hypothetical protein
MSYKPKVIPKLLATATTPALVKTVKVAIATAATARQLTTDERDAISESYLMDIGYRANGELA